MLFRRRIIPNTPELFLKSDNHLDRRDIFENTRICYQPGNLPGRDSRTGTSPDRCEQETADLATEAKEEAERPPNCEPRITEMPGSSRRRCGG